MSEKIWITFSYKVEALLQPILTLECTLINYAFCLGSFRGDDFNSAVESHGDVRKPHKSFGNQND